MLGYYRQDMSCNPTLMTVWTNFTAVGHVTKSVGVKTTCRKKKEKWKAV